jgi:hypothetical protein
MTQTQNTEPTANQIVAALIKYGVSATAIRTEQQAITVDMENGGWVRIEPTEYACEWEAKRFLPDGQPAYRAGGRVTGDVDSENTLSGMAWTVYDWTVQAAHPDEAF